MSVIQSILNSLVDFFSVVIQFAPKFLPAVGQTLLLSVYSIILGSFIGLLTTIFKMTKLKILSGIADVYVSIIRGTPLLLQLVFIFYVLPDWGIMIDAFPSAVIGLAIHSGAYISEIFRGSINSINDGQEEAARAIGMTKAQAFIHVILPQAFKNAVPSLGNQFIIAVKDSSLASTITITEIILQTRQFVAGTFNPFPIFFLAGIYYFIIITILSKILAIVERRLRVNER